ncbi:MAG TPA: ferrochelatase [Chitinophagales bacterium]|nr:ferrochelatase [Chitinophagales bacterium]
MPAKNTGLIIVNLGTPENCTTSSVRAYLNEFLTDERVIDTPWLPRQLLVRGLITPFRAPKSAEAYKSIWTDKGSPLMVISNDFCQLLRQKLDMPLALAMRYGNPTPATALKQLLEKKGKLDEILIAPMYPHYAMSSYETALLHVQDAINKLAKSTPVKVLKPFYAEQAYVKALSATIAPYLANGGYDAVLFSYHGLPVRHLKKSDTTGAHCYASATCCEVKSVAWQTCYKHQVKTTTRLVAKELGLPDDKVLVSFQSRLGRDPWVEPYTDVVLQELPAKGIKNLLVLCPAFVTDCLETLEEINIRGRESFIQSGGGAFTYIPCLNTQPDWVNAFASYCNGYDGVFAQLWD